MNLFPLNLWFINWYSLNLFSVQMRVTVWNYLNELFSDTFQHHFELENSTNGKWRICKCNVCADIKEDVWGHGRELIITNHKIWLTDAWGQSIFGNGCASFCMPPGELLWVCLVLTQSETPLWWFCHASEVIFIIYMQKGLLLCLFCCFVWELAMTGVIHSWNQIACYCKLSHRETSHYTA